MSLDQCRAEVAEFHVRHAVGSSPAKAFAAWWLWRRWSVEPLLAAAHATGGDEEIAINAFHIEERFDGEIPILHLIHANYSNSLQSVRQGVKALAKVAQSVSDLLANVRSSTTTTYSILERLDTALRQLDADGSGLRRRIRLRFELIHLCDDSPESVDKTLQSSRGTFDTVRNDMLAPFEVGLRVIFPPDELDVETVDPAKKPFSLRFAGEMVSDSSNVRFFAGFGYLADLVGLYAQLGEALFSKNVRAFLYKAQDKGPAKYMRESLRRACIPTNGKFVDSPERFAMLHNGVSIAASSAEQAESLILREPNIINGCQTVKNAALWVNDRQVASKIDHEVWTQIRVPLRVLITHDGDLVRDVTVSNNRQNAIRASAFRANDRIQLELADRFRYELQIYYERQEESFKNLKRSNPRFVDEHYSQSADKPLHMEHLAVAIAVAAERPALSVATKPSDLFEDPLYSAIFASSKTRNLKLLVFLRNLLAVLPLAIKDLKQSDAAFTAIPVGRFAYPSMRVLSRYIAKQRPDLIEEFGSSVFASFGKDHRLRDQIRRLMRPQNSGLQQILKDFWWESDTNNWIAATDAEATAKALAKLRLSEVDIFEFA
jgi:hypothetical protein